MLSSRLCSHANRIQYREARQDPPIVLRPHRPILHIPGIALVVEGIEGHPLHQFALQSVS